LHTSGAGILVSAIINEVCSGGGRSLKCEDENKMVVIAKILCSILTGTERERERERERQREPRSSMLS
jgi:hypothetical protein